jgi:hypothetical protein
MRRVDGEALVRDGTQGSNRRRCAACGRSPVERELSATLTRPKVGGLRIGVNRGNPRVSGRNRMARPIAGDSPKRPPPSDRERRAHVERMTSAHRVARDERDRATANVRASANRPRRRPSPRGEVWGGRRSSLSSVRRRPTKRVEAPGTKPSIARNEPSRNRANGRDRHGTCERSRFRAISRQPRIASDAIGRLLGSSAAAAPVVDLTRARTRRGD